MMDRIRRNVLAGFLAVIPILISLWVLQIVLAFLMAAGRPFVAGMARSVRPTSPELADLLLADWFQSLLAVIVALLGLYILGALTKAVLGRRLLGVVDAIMARIPFVQTIYGATRQLVSVLQQGPPGAQRVVLIEFPSPEMKAVGLVTRTFRASDTGQELAAVYVPTTPNPTSGYLEVVPTDRLVWLDWSTNEAMQFIISGGTVAPDHIAYRPGPQPDIVPLAKAET